MDRVTIILPCSRPEYLNLMFASLEMLECNPAYTNLLTIADGNPKFCVDVRNHTEASKFGQRLSIAFSSKNGTRNSAYQVRRIRIADMLNHAKQYIQDCDYILGIEDDSKLPPNTLKKLLYDQSLQPYAGVISGVEINRHGIKSVGAYTVSDVYDPKEIKSILPKEGLQPVDAVGMFAFITKRDHFVNHEFKTYDNNALGPDFEWTLSLRRDGYQNYADGDIKITHMTSSGDISFANSQLQQVVFTKNERGVWRQKIENAV